MKRELKRNGSKKYSTTKRSIAEPIPMKRELKLIDHKIIVVVPVSVLQSLSR